ncbi:ATP/GTP-binding protein [Streptomyces sp. NPDC050287]|uniref:ATP/GTP-binding protein n=1 Tax=Streptomyces sp. NPDC050287 TaxID=3365608 RepID=UPI00379864A4
MSDTRRSWGAGLAAGWERAESTVTRLFLAVVFGVGLVAQFVKPVGDALQDKVYLGGALLTVVGYVLYAEVQRLNEAHSAQRATEESLAAVVRRLDDEVRRLNSVLRPRAGAVVTSEELKREFREALHAGGEVRLTAMGFTGETFAGPLISILQGLPRDPLRKVSLRVLVPDFARETEVPGRVGPDGKACDSPEFRADLRRQIAGHESALNGQIGRMAFAERGTLTVEFRVLHMSPSLKLYFIDNAVVYEGIYDKIDLRPDPWAPAVPTAPDSGAGAGQLLDLIGNDSLLARWSRDGGDHALEIIRRRSTFFETLWSKAHPLSPTPRLPPRPDVS